MKQMVLAALVAVVIVWTYLDFQCDSLQAILKDTMSRRHLGFLSTAIDDKNTVYMFFVNVQNNEWRRIHVLPGAAYACVAGQGTDWQFILTSGVQ